MGPRGPGLSWGVMRPPTGLLLRASRACSWGAEGDCSGLCSRRGQHSLRRGQRRLPGTRAGVDVGVRLPLGGGRAVDAAQTHGGQLECSWTAAAQLHGAPDTRTAAAG